MSKKKLVRCHLRSPGEASYARYVPLTEFKLWRYFITNAHGKIVDGENISLWMDVDSFSGNPGFQGRPTVEVTRVQVEYWDEAKETTTHSERYFPSADYPAIKEIFLGHYPEKINGDHPVSKRRVTETNGYYLLPPSTR